LRVDRVSTGDEIKDLVDKEKDNAVKRFV